MDITLKLCTSNPRAIAIFICKKWSWSPIILTHTISRKSSKTNRSEVKFQLQRTILLVQLMIYPKLEKEIFVKV